MKSQLTRTEDDLPYHSAISCKEETTVSASFVKHIFITRFPHKAFMTTYPDNGHILVLDNGSRCAFSIVVKYLFKTKDVVTGNVSTLALGTICNSSLAYLHNGWLPWQVDVFKYVFPMAARLPKISSTLSTTIGNQLYLACSYLCPLTFSQIKPTLIQCFVNCPNWHPFYPSIVHSIHIQYCWGLDSNVSALGGYDEEMQMTVDLCRKLWVYHRNPTGT